MTSRRRGTLAAGIAVLLLGAACSSPQGTAPDNSLLGKGKDKAKQGQGRSRSNGANPKKGGPGQPGGPPAGATELAVPGPGVEAGGADGQSKTAVRIEGTGSAPTNASVLVTEVDPDAEKEGLTPAYPEIKSIRLEGLGDGGLRATMTFGGEIPDRMPDDKTYMVAGIGLSTEDDNGYAFGAQASDDGWKPYGGAEKTGGKYPGTFEIRGDQVVFTVPWSAIGGPRPFDWYGQASWFRSLAGTTSYSFDSVPNEGPAKYPAG